MVRFYVPLQEEDEITPSFDRSAVTLDMLRERVKSIMSPFSFDFKICHWWAAYQVHSDSRFLNGALGDGWLIKPRSVGDSRPRSTKDVCILSGMPSILTALKLGWE